MIVQDLINSSRAAYAERPVRKSSVAASRLDPHTAGFDLVFVPVGDYPDGDYRVGRVGYWFDLAGIEPAVDDDEFRRQHAEIPDDEWQRLSASAFNRRERYRDLQERLSQDVHELFRLAGQHPGLRGRQYRDPAKTLQASDRAGRDE